MQEKTGRWSDDVAEELNRLKTAAPEGVKHGNAGHPQYSTRARAYMEKYYKEMLAMANS
jgi:hypothetical protein